MAHNCRRCGNCCKYLEFAVGNDAINIEFFSARGLELYEYDDHIVIKIPHKCPHLTDDNQCNIHTEKPEACRVWPQWIEGYPDPCIYGDAE